MWHNLNEAWKRAVSLAWDAYKNNTVPIGAVIVDHEDKIISEGKNRIFDHDSNHPMAGSYMAHAEMTSLFQLKEHEHPNIRMYTLYSTMEPCPMCFGTMMMMHIKHIAFGAFDKFAGAVDLKDASEYLRGKQPHIYRAPLHLQNFQIAMQTDFECRRDHRLMSALLDKWSIDYPDAVKMGKTMNETGYLQEAARKDSPLEDVYNHVIMTIDGMMEEVI